MGWDAFGRAAAAAARGFRALGVRPGDRVIMVSENRPEVAIANTALMALRAIPVPAYTTNTVADHAHVIADSGAAWAVVSSPRLASRLREAAGPADMTLIGMDDGAGDCPFASLLRTDDQDFEDIATEAARIGPDQLACLIYTSGTGGTPKGVMLPHRCMLANCRDAFEMLRPLRLKNEVHLSLLPLSHAFEHTVGYLFLSSIGTEIVHGRGPEHLAADLQAVCPTVMVVVPRVLEVMRGRILGQVARQPRWQQALFNRALSLGARAAEHTLAWPARLENQVLDRVVRRRVRARFGGRLRAAVCGGARLDPALGRFIQGLGIALMQGYGQTECGPVISATPPDQVRIDTVGRVFAHTTLRIAGDGEIVVRGDAVMDGYWNAPDATAAVLQDGWLYTGDIGTLDDAGNLAITDRKRDLIVLSGGENVAPSRVEAVLMDQPEISQAVVRGNDRPGLSGLIVPAENCSAADAARGVVRANTALAVPERVRRHRIVPPFTVENGFLTPTLKIRRQKVIAAYEDAEQPASEN